MLLISSAKKLTIKIENVGHRAMSRSAALRNVFLNVKCVTHDPQSARSKKCKRQILAATQPVSSVNNITSKPAAVRQAQHSRW
jgi:predicted MarR family transcription regulator